MRHHFSDITCVTVPVSPTNIDAKVVESGLRITWSPAKGFVEKYVVSLMDSRGVVVKVSCLMKCNRNSLSSNAADVFVIRKVFKQHTFSFRSCDYATTERKQAARGFRSYK